MGISDRGFLRAHGCMNTDLIPYKFSTEQGQSPTTCVDDGESFFE